MYEDLNNLSIEELNTLIKKASATRDRKIVEQKELLIAELKKVWEKVEAAGFVISYETEDSHDVLDFSDLTIVDW